MLSACYVILFAVTPGCSPLQPADKTQEMYRLTFPANTDETRQETRQDGPVARVEPLRAASGYDSHQMAYSTDPLKIEYYAKSRWLDSPARMLTPLIATMLQETGAFRATVVSPSAVRPDYAVSGEVLRFIQEFTGDKSIFRMTVKLMISSPDGRLLIEEAFDLSGQCPSNDARGAAVAANTLLVPLQQMIKNMTHEMK
jgi:cholesterol transport system auxiliary component